ncbi:DUF6049 family protein [Demequina sp. NBRC 110055]|uniref:DUF6049 family protein n=1 Tax=Demequina sp. NBRC 110055 TaxID=1570344 RepID=UPI0011866720|nr:DUF6049 family protein [Demequina sp. NBRC 110055]
MIRSFAAAALTLAACGLAVAPAAGATEATEPAAASALPLATDVAALEGQLRSVSPAVLRDGDALTASVTARNGGTDPLEGVQVVVSLTDAPLESTDALATFLDDPAVVATTEVVRAPEVVEDPDAADPDATDQDATDDSTDDTTAADGAADTDPLPGATIEPGAATILTAEADAEALDLPADEWGVYGVAVTLETPDGEVVVSAGAVTWADAEVPGVDVAVLAVAQGSPLEVSSSLADTDLDGVAIAVDPTQLTNAMVFDNGLLTREVLRLPAGDPDVTSLAHGDGAALYEFAAQRPSGASVLPLSAMPLLAPMPVADTSSVTLASEAGALAALAGPGTVGLDSLESTVNAVDGASAPLIVPDRVLTEIVSTAAADPAVPGVLLAASALGQSQVIVSVGSEGAITPRTSRLVETLLDAPWVTPSTIADLATSADPAPAELPATAGTDGDLAAEDVTALVDALADLTTFSSTVERPADALDAWGAGLVAGVTTEARTASALREGSFNTALAGAQATLGAVTIAEGSDLNLLADSGDVPITVMNALDRDVTVTVNMDSNSPNLIVESSPTITVGAGLEATALVPVSAVSTANVTVVVGVESPGGDLLSPLQTFDIRVRADWGTAGAAVFTVLLVLLMAAGVIRTIRRGRKDTRLGPSEVPLVAPETEPDGDDLTVADAAADDASASPDQGEDTRRE